MPHLHILGRSFLLAWTLALLGASPAAAGTLSLEGDRFLLDGKKFDMWGIRVASASQSDALASHLLAQLDDYKKYGINTVTVFYQGSSGGYSNPFSSDGTAIDAKHQARMIDIIKACDQRNMVMVVGIFYQRSEFFKERAAWENAVRTVARTLRPYRNVIINIANEQNSGLYRDSNGIFDIGDPESLIELCELVRAEDPQRLVGAGGYNHAKNKAIGASAKVDVLLFDTNGPEDSGALYEEFVAAGVVRKPIVNVEQFGAYSTKDAFPKTPGVYTEENKALFRREVDAARAKPGLYTFFFDARWLQGKQNRYDLAGNGTEDDPGIRWYAEYVQQGKR